MKRWYIDADGCADTTTDGEWVRYEDADAERKRLLEVVRRVRDELPDGWTAWLDKKLTRAAVNIVTIVRAALADAPDSEPPAAVQRAQESAGSTDGPEPCRSPRPHQWVKYNMGKTEIWHLGLDEDGLWFAQVFCDSLNWCVFMPGDGDASGGGATSIEEAKQRAAAVLFALKEVADGQPPESPHDPARNVP